MKVSICRPIEEKARVCGFFFVIEYEAIEGNGLGIHRNRLD
jgi:hypothetical protein